MQRNHKCTRTRTRMSSTTETNIDNCHFMQYGSQMASRRLPLSRWQNNQATLHQECLRFNQTSQLSILSDVSVHPPRSFAGRFASSTGKLSIPATKSTTTQHDERNSPGEDSIKLRNQRPCPMCRSVSTLLGRAVCRKVRFFYRQTQYPNYQIHNYTT